MHDLTVWNTYDSEIITIVIYNIYKYDLAVHDTLIDINI